MRVLGAIEKAEKDKRDPDAIAKVISQKFECDSSKRTG